MAALTVPTIFTAVDRLGPAFQSMNQKAQAFSSKLEMGVANSERAFKRFVPSLGDATKQLLSLGGAAAVFAGVTLSAKSIMDYETAVASFRTIVSDLNDTQFEVYKKQIDSVAEHTKRSSVDVALAFEKIAGLNYKFAETADGLGAVSEAAITLARASGMELGVAAENLVGIMNQFSYGALQADKAINILAAGQAVGAANITQTAEAFVNFGSTAAGANVTLEQSVGLIQTLGKFSLLGADAGTALRGSIIKLQKAGLGYKSGLFSIGDALEEARKKVDKLTTAKKKDAYVTEIFGIHNITAGRILLNNIDTYKQFTAQVSNTNEAHVQADINSKTLAVTLDNLKNAWVNMLTSSEQTGAALSAFKGIVGFVTNNLGTLVSIGASVLLFMGAWKISLLALRASLIASRLVANAFFLVDTIKYIAMSRGLTFSTVALSIAQKELNAIWLANPVGIVVLGLAALAIGIYAVTKAVNSGTAAQKLNNEVYERALEKSIDQRVEATLLFDALRKTTAGTSAYTEVLKKIDAIQPGIVEKYNLQAKAIDSINAAEKELTTTIIKRAEAEVRAEMIREQVRAKLEAQAAGPTFGDYAKAFSSVGIMGGLSAENFKNQRISEYDRNINQLSTDQAAAINTKEVQNNALAQKIKLQNDSTVNIDINDPTGRVKATSKDKNVGFSFSSTMK